MSDYGGGAGSSMDYYEAEARKDERARRKMERERFEPVKIPDEDPRTEWANGPKVYRFDSKTDEGIKPDTYRRASIYADLYAGKLLYFHCDGTEAEMRALHRALGAKLNEITEGDEDDPA